jgi:uncharacterized protein HemX
MRKRRQLMLKESSRFTIRARRGSALVASLAIAAFGLGAAGCGDNDEENANEAVDSVEQEATEAGQEAEDAAAKAKQEAEDAATEAEQEAQDAAEDAQKELDQAQDDLGY